MAIGFGLLALSVFDRFGVQLTASFSVAPGLIALYILAFALLWTGRAVLDPLAAGLYVAIVTVATVSLFVNLTYAPWRSFVSLNSWLLLVVLYAPFGLQVAPSSEVEPWWQWLMSGYLFAAAGLAAFGIFQYVAQFFVRGVPWLIDFSPYIPDMLRGSGLYNTSNTMGTAFKSNGFFLREPSIFSYHMALALILEWTLRRRVWLICLLGLGLVVSYSGSGILMLAAALLVPLGVYTLLRVGGVMLLLVLVYALFGQVLNLDYTLGRVSEFGSDRSSAYCRFIAPVITVADRIDAGPWVSLLGHGSGTMQKLTTVCETTYGKIPFEYGLLGIVVFGAFLMAVLWRAWMPLRARMALAVSWLALGGNLLASDVLLGLFLFCAMWPRHPDGVAKAGGWAGPQRPVLGSKEHLP